MSALIQLALLIILLAEIFRRLIEVLPLARAVKRACSI